jgi:ribonuclease BN (tRNA processing enzyme)
VVELASGADLLIAEATYPEHVPAEDARYLTSAREAAEQAARADVGQLALTHLWPGTDPNAAMDAARKAYSGPIEIARSGLRLSL